MPLLAAAFPCCRDHLLFSPLEDYPDALRRNLADEAYWFEWNHTHGGAATIRIARLGNEAMATRLYRKSHWDKKRCRHARISMADSALLEDAVVVANFWMLDEAILDLGCDGATWKMAGHRRRYDFHHIRRWSPEGSPVGDLGRLMFDLAGLGAVKL